MKLTKTFFSSVLDGMAAPALLFCAQRPYEIDSQKIYGYSTLYNPNRSDSDALRSDWERVGKDMSLAISKYAAQAK